MTQAVPATPPALEIKDLKKSFQGREVVQGISLTAQLGQVTSVLGPNGAGKTTTIECCEGLRVQDSGTIRIFGLDPQTNAAVIRPKVGVMLQDGGLPTSVRALDMIKHVASLYEDPWSVTDLVERLGIESFAHTTVRRLSGGQRQRLMLATALVGKPSLLFLDEPSAGMDPQSRHAVWELIRELKEQGAAILLTTHLMDEAEALSDQVYIVDHGLVIAQGSPRELTSSQTDQMTFETSPAISSSDLEGLLATGSGKLSRTATGAYRISGSVDSELISQLAQLCHRLGATITSLSTGQRTLEDVFLDLTGRSLR